MQLKNRQKQLKIESKKKNPKHRSKSNQRFAFKRFVFFLNEEAGYELNKIKDQEQEIKII